MERSPNQQGMRAVQAGYQSPGASEQFFNRVAGGANDPTRSEMLASNPQLDALYDRQREKTAGAMNDQLAARGGFGSSAGVNMIGDALSNIGAQQAAKEADYNARIAQQADAARLNQLQAYGGLAQQAQQGQLGRLGGAMSSFMGGDQTEITRLNAMMNAATQAQGLRRQRGQDYLGNLQSSQFPMMSIIGQGLQGMLAQDQALMDSATAAELGMLGERLAQDYRAQEQHRDDVGLAADTAGTFFGFGGFGG